MVPLYLKCCLCTAALVHTRPAAVQTCRIFLVDVLESTCLKAPEEDGEAGHDVGAEGVGVGRVEKIVRRDVEAGGWEVGVAEAGHLSVIVQDLCLGECGLCGSAEVVV